MYTAVVWDTHSPIATDEINCAPEGCHAVSLPMPGPGQTWDITHANLIYSGLVANGCGITPTFSIEFDSWVAEMGSDIIGSFSQTDNSTIQPNGYWYFSYKIRVTDGNGGVSDIKLNGNVQALCTNLDQCNH